MHQKYYYFFVKGHNFTNIIIDGKEKISVTNIYTAAILNRSFGYSTPAAWNSVPKNLHDKLNLFVEFQEYAENKFVSFLVSRLLRGVRC